MKKIFFIFLIAANVNLFPQEFEEREAFSSYQLGFFGGINFSSLLGSSAVIEGRTNLADNVNLKISFGYSGIYKDEETLISVQPSRPDYSPYTVSTVCEIKYAVFPLSAGMEYYFTQEKTYPFVFAESGLNIYTRHR